MRRAAMRHERSIMSAEIARPSRRIFVVRAAAQAPSERFGAPGPSSSAPWHGRLSPSIQEAAIHR